MFAWIGSRLQFERSTYRYTSRIKEICHARVRYGYAAFTSCFAANLDVRP